MNSKIIAVDFDGTLCENKWPEIGEANEDMIYYLRKRQAEGDKLILWTCRVGDMLRKAINWCYNYGLIFNAVNENLPEIIDSFGSDTRKIFANEYIDDRNRLISSCREKSNMELWVENEVRIACEHERKASGTKEEEQDYGCACFESALKAYRSLLEDGHSGFSIGMTKYILVRMIEGKPLTPIVDTEDVWSDARDRSGHRGEVVNYQCKRMSSLFKYVYADGTVKYRDVDRFCGINLDNPNASYHSGLIDRVMEEKFPITMPYFPEPIFVFAMKRIRCYQKWRNSKMNNDILIIIHRDKCKDVLEAMYDLINYLPDIRKNMYVDKHRAVIDICNHIRVSFRCGDVYKMAGIRPNYYETWSLEADEFLAQSAAKCCGKKLDSLQDIARVIQEEIKEKEFNDQN